MRISDWSSDVFSSDLLALAAAGKRFRLRSEQVGVKSHDGSLASEDGGRQTASLRQDPLRIEVGHSELGAMERGLFSCGDRSHAGPHPADRDEREHRSEERRVGKGVAVRVALGCRRIHKKKNKKT